MVHGLDDGEGEEENTLMEDALIGKVVGALMLAAILTLASQAKRNWSINRRRAWLWILAAVGFLPAIMIIALAFEPMS